MCLNPFKANSGGGAAPVVNAAPIVPMVVKPIEADVSSRNAAEEERRRRKAAQGTSSTNMTGGMGLESPAQIGGKKLLGD